MAEPGTGAWVFAEQVRRLYGLSRVAYPGTLLLVCVITYALWGVVSSVPLLAAWFVLMVTVTGARYLLYRSYMRASPPPEQARTWASRFVYGAGTTGVLWGFLGSALYPASSLSHQFLVIFLIGGIAISAMVVLAPVRQAFITFMLPALALVTATVFAQGTTLHFNMGMMMVVFLGLILATAPVISEMMRNALRAKFESSELVEQLSQANRSLSERVSAQQSAEEVLRQTTEKFEALIDASPLAIVLRDAEGRVEKWNAAAQRMFGWSEQEARGKHLPQIPSERKEEVLRNRDHILRGETFADVETVRLRRDGTPVHLRVSAAPVHDASGRAIGFLSIITDDTQRKRAEQRSNLETMVTLLLADAHSVEEAMPRVIRTVCEGLDYAYGARWVVDNKEKVMRCSESWCAPEPALEEFRTLSAERVELPGKPGGLNRRVWATGVPVWHEDLSQVVMYRREPALNAGLRSAFAFPILVGGEFYGTMEFFGRGARPRDDQVLEVAQTVGSQIGQFIGRKQAETNLQFYASHDPLTGLFNRGIFNERLQQALAQAVRFERSLALLFIDLDGFKLVNDTFGHSAGDTMLIEIAARLRATLREGDVIARMGGDEFVVLVEEFGEAVQIGEVAKKVLDTVSRPVMLQGQECQVTTSIGISTYPVDGRDGQTLLKNADIAMYRAKEQGKNSFRFHSPQMNVHLAERLSLESNLRRAMERGELLLLYQPKVGMRDGQVTGVEALVRWRHPTQGMINPAEFVPIAEDTGLIMVIGEWILQTACNQVRAWQQQGMPWLRMAVNLSGRQFAQENLIQVVREALHNASIDPSRLDLEITEGMVIRNPDRAVRLFAQLRELGVRLTLDDFGTGYSSLGYLMRCPVDGVKIDRSFVHDLPGSDDGAAVARAVIAMAHSLKLHVTAEGVETREQWEFLRELKCDEMQGHYFSAPMPADVITGLLRKAGEPGKRASIQSLRPWRAGGGTNGTES